jgi:uncharacterized protein (DUF1697 family)
VLFLAADPGEPARAAARRLATGPEELHVDGRELFIYFPHGMARPTLPVAVLERTLHIPGPGRNWNTVTKLLAMAEARSSR